MLRYPLIGSKERLLGSYMDEEGNIIGVYARVGAKQRLIVRQKLLKPARALKKAA